MPPIGCRISDICNLELNRHSICKIPIVFETANEIEKNGVGNAYMRSVELRFVVFSRWFCHFSAGLGNPALRSQESGIRNLEFEIKH